MVRGWAWNPSRWAGLIALGVGVGILATSVGPVRAQLGDPGQGGDKKVYPDFLCKQTDCFEQSCASGDPTCGDCTGGLYTPFMLCRPETGESCTPDEAMYGTMDCNGACAGDPLKGCTCSWIKCG